MAVEHLSIPVAAPATAFDYTRAMEYLVEVAQRLSLARSLPAIMEIVRHAARELTGADGATFVLRDEDKCYYADEEAIAPLWKGSRFPMRICISGWVMMNRQPVIIEDIYKDPRIPIDAYRPTFVRSLAMVPIRTMEPIGAIGNYWATHYRPTAEQIKALRALADTTALAIENVQLYEDLERRVQELTAELNSANETIQHLLLTDELTGLHNRRGFMVLATQMLHVAKRANAHTWILYADLDGLKRVNDQSGHEAGDLYLRAGARVLREITRKSDVVARLGGDEFAIFGTGLQSPDYMQKRLQSAVQQYNQQHPEAVQLSISSGVVLSQPDEDISLEQLLDHADHAMYEMKRTRSHRAVSL